MAVHVGAETQQPNNLAGGVHGNDSSIPLARACKDEPVAEDICAYAANAVTCNSESLTGKTARREAHRWWRLVAVAPWRQRPNCVATSI